MNIKTLRVKHQVLFSFIFLICTASGFSQTLSDIKNDIISKTFSQRWELDSIDQCGTFRLTSYKPIYITAGRWSSNPNQRPTSENPDNTTPVSINYNEYEAKFQLSFKTKVLQSIFWNTADIWVAYTQVSHWQIYNTKLSRAFREINYEPELIVNFPIKVPFMGGKFRTIGMSFNHQSNGKQLPQSRSWNRVIFHIGYEKNNWEVTFKPWIRSGDEEDENPAITDFIGDGELNIGYVHKRHQFYLITTHSFSRISGGSMQFNYVFPLKGHLRGQFQVFDGYGETLIDYNHRQTTIGLGISFANW
jgi:phospholipase A1